MQGTSLAEEEVMVAVDKDGFMESFFRRVGVTATSRMCTGLEIRRDSRHMVCYD